MSLNARQAATHFAKHPLPAVTLLYGEEPQLHQEILEVVRRRAEKDGFHERRRLDAGRSAADWQTLLTEIETPSLFSPACLIELHGKQKTLDKNAATVLRKIALLDLKSTRLLLHLPNLEKAAQSAWFKALAQGDFLDIRSYALSENEFIEEIQQRLRAHHLRLTPEAFSRFLQYHEGNLSAAEQSMQRLRHSPQNAHLLDVPAIETLLDDFSHHSVFAFRESLLQGDWLACYRRAAHIEQSDKHQIILLTWFLARDAELLLQMHARPREQHDALFKAVRIYARQQVPFKQALPRFSPSLCANLLQLAAKLDRINKGAERGNPWLTLRQYCLLRVRK